MKKLTTACALALLSICLMACKKYQHEKAENALVGDWQELNLTGITRTLKFTDVYQFQLSSGDKMGYATRFTGTYQIHSDSLKVQTNEVLSQEPGKPVVKTSPTFMLYEKATFSVLGDTLTLKYISYPADAPVTTVAKFRKGINIDQGGIIK